MRCKAASFRRNILKDYLTPQFVPSDPNTYPRYDYRKKVEGVEAKVLYLDRHILKVQK